MIILCGPYSNHAFNLSFAPVHILSCLSKKYLELLNFGFVPLKCVCILVLINSWEDSSVFLNDHIGCLSWHVVQGLINFTGPSGKDFEFFWFQNVLMPGDFFIESLKQMSSFFYELVALFCVRFIWNTWYVTSWPSLSQCFAESKEFSISSNSRELT